MTIASGTRPSPRRRRAALAAATIAVAALLGACSGDDGAPVLDLADKGEGTCLVAAADLGPEVTNIPTIDCAKEHTHELYAVVPYEESDVFPGLAALDTFAERECIARFEPYVGVSAFDSSLSFSWLVPTLASWNNNDDRDILCVVGLFDGNTLTESVRDSRR
ncbi:MAG: septum formation family protein [Ilumatobacteraceae bacterium]